MADQPYPEPQVLEEENLLLRWIAFDPLEGNCPAFHRDGSPAHHHLVIAMMIVLAAMKISPVMNQICKENDINIRDLYTS